MSESVELSSFSSPSCPPTFPSALLFKLRFKIRFADEQPWAPESDWHSSHLHSHVHRPRSGLSAQTFFLLHFLSLILPFFALENSGDRSADECDFLILHGSTDDRWRSKIEVKHSDENQWRLFCCYFVTHRCFGKCRSLSDEARDTFMFGVVEEVKFNSKSLRHCKLTNRPFNNDIINNRFLQWLPITATASRWRFTRLARCPTMAMATGIGIAIAWDANSILARWSP